MDITKFAILKKLAGGGGASVAAVRYDEEQTLTDEQKTQAKTNIDAAGTLDLPYNIGAPLTYFSNDEVSSARNNNYKAMTPIELYVDGYVPDRNATVETKTVEDNTVLTYNFTTGSKVGTGSVTYNPWDYDLQYILIIHPTGTINGDQSTIVTLQMSNFNAINSYEDVAYLEIPANTKAAAVGCYFDRFRRIITPIVGIGSDNIINLVKGFKSIKLSYDSSNVSVTTAYTNPVKNYRKQRGSLYGNSTLAYNKNFQYNLRLTLSGVNTGVKLNRRVGLANEMIQN